MCTYIYVYICIYVSIFIYVRIYTYVNSYNNKEETLTPNTRKDLATATRYNTLQYAATHCNTLQHTATHCNTLQHRRKPPPLKLARTSCLILPIASKAIFKMFNTATLGNTLQHTASHCNTLQHTATHCNTQEEAPAPKTRKDELFDIPDHLRLHIKDVDKSSEEVQDNGAETWLTGMYIDVCVCCRVLQCVAACCSVLQ